MARVAQFLPILCVALGACRLTTEAQNHLDVVLSVDRAVVSPSNDVGITVRVTNRGPGFAQTTNPLSYGCARAYVILDESGGVIPLPDRVCGMNLYADLDLAPGDSVVIHDRWSADRTDGAHGALPVALGRYRLVAQVWGEQRVLASDPVSVTVAAPE